jgi:hypothetical protein
MGASQPAKSLDATHKLLRTAMLQKKPIAAFYAGYRRLLCPYVLGRNKQNHLHVLCYQYGGGSASKLKAHGSPQNWRCIAVDKLSAVEIIDGPWQSAERHSRVQTCIEHVELDAEKPPFLVS